LEKRRYVKETSVFKKSTNIKMTRRIAFISTMSIYSWGGSEEYWYTLAKQAIDQKCEVFVLAFRQSPVHPKLLELESLGANLCLRNKSDSLLNRIVFKILGKNSNSSHYKKLVRWKPDMVIISQGGTFEVLKQPFLISWLQSEAIPYYLICHGNNEYQTLSNSERDVAVKFFSGAKKLLFPAKWALNLVCRQLLADLKNYCIFSNPLNIDITKQKIPIIIQPMAKLKMAMVGSLTIEWKGHDIVLMVLSRPEWQQREWHLNIFGDGKDKDYIIGLIKYLNLESKVTLMGHTNDIENVWKDNHILLMPSRVETAPISIVEAMICCKPTVATNIGGISEWINSEVGFLASAPNEKEFSIALENAFLAINDWNNIGIKARAFALEKINRETVNLIDLF